jgi:hypothetical protein
MDLRHSLIPDELIDEMIKNMPEHEGAAAPEDQEVAKYDYVDFMQKYLGPATSTESGASANGSARR